MSAEELIYDPELAMAFCEKFRMHSGLTNLTNYDILWLLLGFRKAPNDCRSRPKYGRKLHSARHKVTHINKALEEAGWTGTFEHFCVIAIDVYQQMRHPKRHIDWFFTEPLRTANYCAIVSARLGLPPDKWLKGPVLAHFLGNVRRRPERYVDGHLLMGQKREKVNT